MVLSAGLGTRMQSLTSRKPKPLVNFAGRPLIDHVLDRLLMSGICRVVVNTHHFGNQLESYLAERADVVISLEPKLLETGGGVKRALSHFEEDAFYVLNCDVVWIERSEPALKQLATRWTDSEMDALLLLFPTKGVAGYCGSGDYNLDDRGRAFRCKSGEKAKYLFAGIQILHPRLFDDAPEGPFSLNLLYDVAERAGRLYATIYDGRWFHVGTPEELRVAELEILESASEDGRNE